MQQQAVHVMNAYAQVTGAGAGEKRSGTAHHDGGSGQRFPAEQLFGDFGVKVKRANDG